MRIHIIGGPGSGKTTLAQRKDPEIGNSRMIAANHLAAYRDKLIQCRRPGEVEALFKRLSQGEEAMLGTAKRADSSQNITMI